MTSAEGQTRPRVDVCIVTWNTRDLTVEMLGRLFEVAGAVDLRVLVRDNASSDGTVAAISSQFPAVEVEAGDENLGFGAGMNRLLRRADAPWVLLLNSDAWPEPGAIEALVRRAERDPTAALVAPKLLRPDGEVEESTHRFPSLRQAAVLATPLHRVPGVGERFLVPGYWRFDRVRSVDWVVGAAWLLRREALLDVGGFDERFVMYVEDLEWCLRAQRRGWHVVFEPDAVVRHLGNASGSQRYGDRRTATWLHNTFALYRDVHGALPTLAFRALNIVAALRFWCVARLRRDHESAARWAAHVKGSASFAAPEGAMRDLGPAAVRAPAFGVSPTRRREGRSP